MIFKSKKRISVGIIGGAGYGGSELLRILLFHPKVQLLFVTSRQHAGKKVASVNRFLTGVTDLVFTEPDIDGIPQDTDLVFFATPHGVSMTMMKALVNRVPKARVVDLSGDFRLKNANVYRQYYGKEHGAAELLERFFYGLPEFCRDSVKNAQYVANPGCFATGIIFALYPLFLADAVGRAVHVVSVTGSSGSGESPKAVTHHPYRAKNFKSYKILEHQHLPEIQQFFRSQFPGRDTEIGIVPQSGPFVRGIYTTSSVYGVSASSDDVRAAFESSYENERFVRIVDESPEVTTVCGTNHVEVAFVCKNDWIVSMSAIDNLVRGASGQAVQNMNLMFGFDEDEGLLFPGMRP
ncbi:MAG: N-acetyl-gamma-glutamyl-phosphate reductase [Spirochaetes bacterium]|nr:N-acetyl-gamma-glutamyl-phosphate reductase [Spirochaetota bacterium]